MPVPAMQGSGPTTARTAGIAAIWRREIPAKYAVSGGVEATNPLPSAIKTSSAFREEASGDFAP